MENCNILKLIKTASGNNGYYNKLVLEVNDLINNNYTQLIQLLYKIDVSEKKLKDKLKEHPTTDAAVLITNLILQRQAEKKVSFLNTTPDDCGSSDEKW